MCSKTSLLMGLRFIFINLLLFTTLLSTEYLQASDCFLKIQKHRSLGTTVVSNSCNIEDQLSLNSQLEVEGGTRLWLESKIIHNNSGNYWLICQNRSTSTIKVKINSFILPWISLGPSSQCSNQNERIECFENDTKKETLFCASAIINKKASMTEPQEEITSVEVRGSQNNDHAAIRSQLQPTIKPAIDLCRKVSKADYPISLTLHFDSKNDITEISVTNGIGEKQFEECAVEVVRNHNFLRGFKNTQITLSFD